MISSNWDAPSRGFQGLARLRRWRAAQHASHPLRRQGRRGEVGGPQTPWLWKLRRAFSSRSEILAGVVSYFLEVHLSLSLVAKIGMPTILIYRCMSIRDFVSNICQYSGNRQVRVVWRSLYSMYAAYKLASNRGIQYPAKNKNCAEDPSKIRHKYLVYVGIHRHSSQRWSRILESDLSMFEWWNLPRRFHQRERWHPRIHSAA